MVTGNIVGRAHPEILATLILVPPIEISLTMKPAKLIVSPEASKLGLVAIDHLAQNVCNRERDESFEQLKFSLCSRLRQKYTPQFVKNDRLIAGFRELRKAVGRSPRKYPCSIESLIGCLQRRGSTPAINLVVDIYNVVSLETRLALGAHDLDRVDGSITLRFASGNEHFVPLGSSAAEPVHAGEYCYVDDGGEVLCRLDYKQCDKTKLSLSTKRCLFILQGNAKTTEEQLQQAKERLIELLVQFGGTS